jgi:hypothetical protein
MYWKQLKDFCNSLNEEQLKKDVVIMRDEETISRINAKELGEDEDQINEN